MKTRWCSCQSNMTSFSRLSCCPGFMLPVHIAWPYSFVLVYFLDSDFLSSLWCSTQPFERYCMHLHSEIFSGSLLFYKCLALAFLAPYDFTLYMICLSSNPGSVPLSKCLNLSEFQLPQPQRLDAKRTPCEGHGDMNKDDVCKAVSIGDGTSWPVGTGGSCYIRVRCSLTTFCFLESWSDFRVRRPGWESGPAPPHCSLCPSTSLSLSLLIVGKGIPGLLWRGDQMRQRWEWVL